MTRRVIFPDPDIWTNKETAMSNRPLTDAERQLMLGLAVRVIADQSGIPHTDDDGYCEACAASASAVGQFIEDGGVQVRGDAFNCYLDVGPNTGVVHATREWLAFHAEHPEAIDFDKHCRPSAGDR